MNKNKYWLVSVLICSPLLGLPVGVDAQEDNAVSDAQADATEVDPEVVVLQKEKTKAELEADIAEAKKREAQAENDEAGIGAGSTKPLEGTVTLNEGAGYFSEILAYRSMAHAATSIAKKVVAANETPSKTIIVTDQTDMAAVNALWNLVVKQIEIVRGQMRATGKKFQNPSGADDQQEVLDLTPASSVAAGLSSIADILGYFREDTSFTKYDVTLNNKALVAEVASAILAESPDTKIVIPAYGFGDDGQIVTGLGELAILRNDLQILLDAIKSFHKDKMSQLKRLQDSSAKKKSELAALQKKKPVDAAAVAKLKREIEARSTQIKLLNDSPETKYVRAAEMEIPKAIEGYESLVTTLVQPRNEGEKAPLERLSDVDALRADRDALYLIVNVVGQGGEVEITKSIWTGGRISYIGGSTTMFFLVDSGGTVSASGTESNYHKAWYGQRRGVEKMKTDAAFEN